MQSSREVARQSGVRVYRLGCLAHRFGRFRIVLPHRLCVRFQQERRRRQFLAKAVVQVLADPRAFPFRHFQNLAFEGLAPLHFLLERFVHRLQLARAMLHALLEFITALAQLLL
jgi:hypothetical protein